MLKPAARSLTEFIHDTTYADLPRPVVATARTCLLDLLGVAAAGSRTALSRIACDFAVRHFAPGEGQSAARLLFDGRRVSAVGAAYAGAASIDSFDAHDGHALTKGHAGVAILPTVLALATDGGDRSGRELLTRIVVGYEVALRAGIALHATAADYHTSGAWNALGCAAVGARRLRLSGAATRHALGIAEFHGPRSPMMRCITHPTMVKDGSAWGALAGLSAAYLAESGFTGAPATLTEGGDTAFLWTDLGCRWRILEQYLKPYPVCRWAHPAIQAAQELQRQLTAPAADIAGITVTTFHQAAQLACRHPQTTEEAQYSLPFPLAAALVRGNVGVAELDPSGFADPEIRRLSDIVSIEESTRYNALFPAERWAHVAFQLADGRVVTSPPATASGDPDKPLSAEWLTSKFRALSRPCSAMDGPRALRPTWATSATPSPRSPTCSTNSTPGWECCNEAPPRLPGQPGASIASIGSLIFRVTGPDTPRGLGRKDLQ